MKDNDLIFLLNELNKEFELRVEKANCFGHFKTDSSGAAVGQYRREAKALVDKYIRGCFSCSFSGKPTNSEGQYVNEKGEPINYKGERINDKDELINEKGEVIYVEYDYYEIRKAIKNRVITFRENSIDDYIDSITMRLPYPKRNIDIDIANYLKLSFLCNQWGIYQNSIGEQLQARKYLFNALQFVDMWLGATEVLKHMHDEEQEKQSKINAAREGGKQRGENYTPLKIKVIELLKKNMPEDGWKTKKAVVDSLECDINQFIKDEQKKLDLKGKGEKLKFATSWDKMHQRITDWTRNDDQVKAAFDEVVKKRPERR
ncbi:hypothetical protein AB4K01_02750 [Serratia fonticola]|uniref:hypothetical protein n=1 Tax=Serratia fonticola TaxID=47917 RepID=UPI0034C69304